MDEGNANSNFHTGVDVLYWKDVLFVARKKTFPEVSMDWVFVLSKGSCREEKEKYDEIHQNLETPLAHPNTSEKGKFYKGTKK